MRRKKLIQEQFHTLQLPLESKDIILSLIDLLEKDVTPDQKHNIEKSIKKNSLFVLGFLISSKSKKHEKNKNSFIFCDNSCGSHFDEQLWK